MFMFNTSGRHTCVIEITEMLSYKDNKYDSQEVFLPLLCFLELEAALTVLSKERALEREDTHPHEGI